MPTLVTTTTWEAQQNGVSGIDLFVPVINYVEGKPGSKEAGNQRAKFGADTWWYQSCMSFGCSSVGGGRDGTGESGWPTYAVDSDGTRNRAMEWLSFSYDMSGELYYEMTMSYFNGDPWTNQTGFGGTGDGTLFYPGTTARIGGKTEIPVESLRLKEIRDGMEDYELLALAKKLGAGDQAKAIAAGVFPKTYQATATPAALDSARAELAALILHALGKDTPTDTGSGSTGSAGGTTSCDTTACNSTGTGAGPQPKLADQLGSGGCSSSGAQSLWLALPIFAAFALRRRRRAAPVA
jgi:MYXO-CTERM domain-containing protein